MAPEADTDELLFTVEGPIARATFNRPQARNALTFAMYERLAGICRELADRPEIRALVITGAGEKAFAAGTDISQFRAFSTPEDAIGYEGRIDSILGAIERCPVPTIAAIRGACTGGGAAIAACCDLRVMSADARFGFPIARTLGNCLSTASLARLAALIGPSRVKDILFTGRLMGAAEAKAIGLAHLLVEDAGAWEAECGAFVRLVAANAPLTLRATKEGLRRLQQVPPEGDDLVTMTYMSADFREGIESFLGKRPPVWTGT